ncbi:hypothetical protein IF721_13570 (plasmid) [Staphylococcus aureus]|nr:hypothetical protein [Staphylococcus aureus]EHS7180680.1 hypothetical protein [Staphylococcus pseudintermedius]PAJ49894.1 hypothetical protein APW25_12060 [Staphylococcus aureus]ULW18155.1 hypothetical protein IF721_13570 [Staphylococcus aureus]BBL19086.1 hypothetical protein SAJRA307_P0380 [Staphylococcus aureus]HAR6425137.1 hypothetical protein [Staphylococcus pseudintermedius]
MLLEKAKLKEVDLNAKKNDGYGEYEAEFKLVISQAYYGDLEVFVYQNREFIGMLEYIPLNDEEPLEEISEKMKKDALFLEEYLRA